MPTIPVTPLPHALSEYITDMDTFWRMVSDRLYHLTGINYSPSPGNTDLTMSDVLESVPITQEVIDHLRLGGFSVQSSHENIWSITHDRTHCYSRGQSTTLVFLTQWHETRAGVSEHLTVGPSFMSESYDEAGKQKFLRKLYVCLLENNHVAHTRILKLIQEDCVIHHTWAELGIEENISIKEHFDDFLARIEASSPTTAAQVKYVVENPRLNPLSPSPILFAHLGQLMPGIGRVPQSAYDKLTSLWEDQLTGFGKRFLELISR